MPHQYDQVFMDYTSAGSRHAATRVVALLHQWHCIQSVLDVGCAAGTWLSAWRDSGVDGIAGVDGDYVQHAALRIPVECFHARDLSRAFDLGCRFDLVQSLEVAEHIDAAHADTFVRNLVGHARGLILFSAAPPGQGGEHHVNEQPYEYWRRLFAIHGYQPFDAIRSYLAGDMNVSFWYRYNTLLYINGAMQPALAARLAASAVADDRAIPDVTPVWFQLRKLLVRILPPTVRMALARIKARGGGRGR